MNQKSKLLACLGVSAFLALCAAKSAQALKQALEEKAKREAEQTVAEQAEDEPAEAEQAENEPAETEQPAQPAEG